MFLMIGCAVAGEVQWEKGCVSGAVYWGDKSLTNLLVKVCIFVNISDHFILVLATVSRTLCFCFFF